MPDGDYKQGYLDGMKDACEHSELSAYYAGVGYGKKLAGDDNIGFNSHEELEQFQHGIKSKDKYFNSFRSEPLSWWERLFGKKTASNKTLKYSNPKKRENNVRKRARKIKKSKKKKARKN